MGAAGELRAHDRRAGADLSRAARRPVWLILASICALVFFVLGLSHESYDLFSPPEWSWHVLLRKAESIAAFFAVGYTLDRAVIEAGRPLRSGTATAAVALYSGALEVAQFFHGSHEGLLWNAVDVVCGGAGGALADLAIGAQRRRLRPRSRVR